MKKSKLLDNIIAQIPQDHLFHYTSPTGLIGILKEKELWATNAVFQNDIKEREHAADIAKNCIYNVKRKKSDSNEVKLLEKMYESAGSAAERIYLASFSEEQNLLSQWRAYCPRGGYSLGIPSKLLLEMVGKQKNMPANQSFILAKCVYDQHEQQKIIMEIINSYLEIFRKRHEQGIDIDDNINTTSHEFAQYLGRYGCIIKHHQFSEEREWRIISPMMPDSNSNIDYRDGGGIAIPYFKFNLDNGNKVNSSSDKSDKFWVMAGPSRYSNRLRSASTQFIMTRYLNYTFNSVSSIPFRTSS